MIRNLKIEIFYLLAQKYMPEIEMKIEFFQNMKRGALK